MLFNASVEGAAWDEETSQWTLTTRAGEQVADFLVLALPFEATAKLLPLMPPADGVEILANQIAQQHHGPICSVHLWFDREITDLDHAVLLDRQIHWMYNKSRLQPWRKSKGSYLELVVSASHEFAALSREEAIELSVRELAEFFPAVAAAKLEKAVLVKEVRATFTVPPGIDAREAWLCIAVAQLRSGRRLDSDRLALNDGKRRAKRPPRRRVNLRRNRRAAKVPHRRSQPARPHAVSVERVAQMVLCQGTTSVVPHEAHKQWGFSP